MAQHPDDEQLRQLHDRIAAAKSAASPPSKAHQEEHYSKANIGWRMVTELVAGLGIGFGIGYGLDVLLGTIPIFLVIFTLLGFAAGVKTMMRTAKEVQTTGRAHAPDTDDEAP
ncbi:AtpZ/AtpI family protein [Pseudoruegeria sp. SK021]|uniref:AtpZ/AtpI family protein n=1 Tax=Pseudoruegeria sp. SK021 TaxID=1933035 RepID=UPI000A225939|nr:AtpZ/AtpI family protein [Pseudoruegeria sp. SK021]OSP56586.1 F0F1 ATP synthase subunit I [Pseudoruegeria sp. SK021]